MIYRFAKAVPVLSMIINTVINYIYDTHIHRITEWNDMLLDPVILEEYVNVINVLGSSMEPSGQSAGLEYTSEWYTIATKECMHSNSRV